MKGAKAMLLSIAFAFSCLVLTALAWETPLLLCLFLLVNALAMVAVGTERKRDALLFAFSAFFGAAAESFTIWAGAAWSYQQPHFFGIPIWLPLVWGTAGVFLLRLSDAIKENL